MIHPTHLRELIIKPTLTKLHAYSDDAVELLMFTAAVESNGGTYLKQLEGPALGIYQMEPATYNDIWFNYINYRNEYIIMLSAAFNANRMAPEDRLVYDLQYATAMARLHFLRIPHRIPNRNDLDAVWEYYKLHYNTPLGKSTKAKSIKAYSDYVALEKPNTKTTKPKPNTKTTKPKPNQTEA